MSQDCCRSCVEELDLKNDNLKYLLTKEKLLKKKYHQLLVENLQKDIIIRDLKKKIASRKYDCFSGEISTDCVNDLEKIGDSKGEDATFVKTIINDFYTQEELKKKTVSYRTKNPEKTAISPEKKKSLEKLFAVRLNCVQEKEEHATRTNHLSKLIRNVIDSAGRKNLH